MNTMILERRFRRCGKMMPLFIICFALSLLAGCGQADGTAAASSSLPANRSTAELSATDPADGAAPADRSGPAEADEASGAANMLTLAYDDRYTFSSGITHISTASISSHQTGTGDLDQEVLRQDSANPQKAIAVGCGMANVTLEDGGTVTVVVEPAKISLLMIVGQSNGEGRPSDVNELATFQQQWVVNEEGTVYSTYGPSDDRDGKNMYQEVCWYEDTEQIGSLSVSNFNRFLPNSLTDNSQNDVYNSTNKLTDAEGAIGKGGIDSALGYEWVKLTGEKVWIINAAHHGSKISTWNPEDSDNNFWEAVDLYKGAEQILSREIEAGHYELSHKGVFWCQGENNKNSGAEYDVDFPPMQAAFERELAGSGIAHMEQELEFTGLLMVRAAADDPTSTDDFFLTGPRRCQYYYAISEEYPTVYLASQVEESWSTDELVKAYFSSKYPSQEDYAASLPFKNAAAAVLPESVADVHCQIHFTQLAYNEIGIDAADNICYALGYAQAPSTQVESITLVSEDGLTPQNDQELSLAADDTLFFAAKVYPTYLTKTVKVEDSDSLCYAAAGISFRSGTEGTVTFSAGDLSTGIKISQP